MEPQLPKPRIPGVEQSPQSQPEQPPAEFDKGLLQQEQEKNLSNPELDQPQSTTTDQPDPQQVTDSTTTVAQPQIQPATQKPNDNDSPIVASDEDVIEKEWVDKAKKIVSETKDDPRKQKHDVSTLQADYIEKRYGKVIKLPDES